MCVAVQLDRRNIPAGIWRQKDMGSPNTRTSKPLIARKCAAADRAYGPAPTIATSHAVMVVSLENLPPGAQERGLLKWPVPASCILPGSVQSAPDEWRNKSFVAT